MKTLFGLLILLSATAEAIPVGVNRRDAKFPTQQMVEKQSFTNPIASNTSTVASNKAGPTSAAAATLSSFDNTIDLPRNLTITPGGTTGDIESCVITATGTNIFGSSITETFTFAANDTGTQTGSKAFKTLTLLSWPADCESGGFAAQWNIGVGEKLGVKRCMTNAGDIFFSLLNGSKEATAPTMAVDSDEVEKNTADFNGAMNGSNDFDLYFMQNFGCFAP